MATEPKKLGKYDIVGKIGKGAMGEVYKGRDPLLNRYVAIKIIADTLDTDPDLVERFKREARSAASLNHPNIVTIYDFVEDQGHLYMVMELLEGQDLKELIKSGSPLTIDQILSIMEQIADGLGFAHTKGVIHRDLKPANIHLSKNGQVKILDFGLVHEASSDMTKTGQVMGTPNYMSPEQVQGLKVDPRSDIFSLGAVFYELLTRRKPFSADSIHATMYKVVQGEREPLDRYTHLPPPIVSMVDRALNKEPEDRFEDAGELRAHLRELRSEVLAGGEVDSTLTSQAATVITPAAEPGSHPSGAAAPASRRSRSGSGGPGTLRSREISTPSVGAGAARGRSPILYVVLLLLAAAAAGAYFMTRSAPGPAQDVEALSEALIATQEQLMSSSLERRDFEAAITSAEEILQADPDHAEALRVRGEARQTLQQIDAAVAQTRAALESGDTSRAADALARVLQLAPAHPLGRELSGQLDQHFQTQADGAREEMEAARRAASGAGASSRPEFVEAERLREQASAEYNRTEYTNAAQRYLEARQGYVRSRSAHEQAQAQRRAQAARAEEEEAAAAAELQARLREAEAGWNRLRAQPLESGIERQPSYQRAMAEEAVAQRLKSSGDAEGAAQAFASAASYLERARREHQEAQRAAEESSRQAAATTTVAAPAATSSVAAEALDENAVRSVIADYERAIENEDIELFRRVKPNLTRDEERRLLDAFANTDSHQIELAIDDITFRGDTAEVSVTRRDEIVVRGRRQNGNTRSQVFTLSKAGGRWVIVELGP